MLEVVWVVVMQEDDLVEGGEEVPEEVVVMQQVLSREPSHQCGAMQSGGCQYQSNYGIYHSARHS